VYGDRDPLQGTTIISATGTIRHAMLGAASTVSACCAACRRHPMCRGFSFSKRDKLCYLKTLSDIGGAWQRREDAAFTSGMDPGPAEPGMACALGGCYSYVGCYKDWGDSRRFPVWLRWANVDECAEAALKAGYRCVVQRRGRGQCIALKSYQT
jgi:hypothetical protein